MKKLHSLLRRTLVLFVTTALASAGIATSCQAQVLIVIPSASIKCPPLSKKLYSLSIKTAKSTLPLFWEAYKNHNFFDRNSYHVAANFIDSNGKSVILWVRITSVAITEFNGVIEEDVSKDKSLKINSKVVGTITDPIDWRYGLQGGMSYGNFYWRASADNTCDLKNKNTLYLNYLRKDPIPPNWQ